MFCYQHKEHNDENFQIKNAIKYYTFNSYKFYNNENICNVFIAQSNIPNSGLGGFLKPHIAVQPHSIVTIYTGIIYDTDSEEYKNLTDEEKQYTREFGTRALSTRGIAIEPELEGFGIGSFLNRQTPEHPFNVDFKVIGNRIFIVTLDEPIIPIGDLPTELILREYGLKLLLANYQRPETNNIVEFKQAEISYYKKLLKAKNPKAILRKT